MTRAATTDSCRELLLACARAKIDPGSNFDINDLLQKPIDWQRFGRLAANHRVSALAAKQLSRSRAKKRIPRDLLESLQSAYQTNVLHYLRAKAELGRLLLLLQEVGIPAIVLKGMVLAEQVYGDAALRPMGDVDILVREHHLDCVYSVAQELGLSSGLTPELERSVKATHRHYPRLMDASGTIALEIHRHILREDIPFYFDVEGLWRRSRPISLGHAKALSLAPEDLLSHLCLGFFLDSRSMYPSRKALARVVDLAQTILHFRAEMDWGLWVEQVLSRGYRAPVAWSLEVTRRLLDVGPPEEVRQRICESLLSANQIDLFIERRLFRDTPWILHELIDPADHSRWNLLKAAGRRLLPTPGQLKATYPNVRGEVPVRVLYRWHLAEVAASAAGYLGNPAGLRQDLKVYRWLYHSYSGT